MNKLLIIGAGGHGKVVAEVAQSCGYDVIYFLDDNNSDAIGKISDTKQFVNEYKYAFVGIGNNRFRKEIMDSLIEIGFKIPILIHPSSYVSPSAKIDIGTVVEPNAMVNANTIVKRGCIISIGTIIDHDVVVEEYVHANAGSIIKAGAKVEAYRRIEPEDNVRGFY